MTKINLQFALFAPVDICHCLLFDRCRELLFAERNRHEAIVCAVFAFCQQSFGAKN